MVKEKKSILQLSNKGEVYKLRSDHGSQYDSSDFMNEMKFLGLNMSKAYVRSPECNGVIERFYLTLEEELLQIKSFNSLEEAQREIADFVEKYNTHWKKYSVFRGQDNSIQNQ